MATSYYAEHFILHRVKFKFQYRNGIGTGIGIRLCISDGVFTLRDFDSYTEADTDSCSEIGIKMGTEPTYLNLGLGLGSVETLLNIIIKPNSLCLGIGLRINVLQCK